MAPASSYQSRWSSFSATDEGEKEKDVDFSRRTSGEWEKEKDEDGDFSRRPSDEEAPPSPPPEPKREQNIDEWEGPDDPANPLNWRMSKKVYHSFVPAGIAFVCTLGSSIITPGRESIQSDLGVSAEVALLPYVLYVLGLAFGPMIAAPCSETFGRRTVYLISMLPFALFSMGAGFSNGIASLCICRFFAGIFGSTGLAIGSATLSEIWPPADRGLPMAIYVSTPFLGPAVGPLVGGYSTQAYGWKWTQWTLLFFTVVCITPAIFMRESYKPTILRHRAKARGHQPAAHEKRTPWESTKFFLRKTLTRPVHMAFAEPVVAGFTIYIALNFGMLYGFFAAFPYVFQTNYGFDLGTIGLTFLGLGVGVLVGCCIIIYFSRVIYRRKHRSSTSGQVPPEARLHIAMIGSVMMPVSLFWFAWSAEYTVFWLCPVIAEAVFGCGNLLIYMAAVFYLMDFYGPMYGASAMGANNLARYLMGAAFSCSRQPTLGTCRKHLGQAVLSDSKQTVQILGDYLS